MKKLIGYTLLVLITVSFNIPKLCNCRYLTASSVKYWDTKRGYHWMFKSDSTFQMYRYFGSDSSKITQPEFDDIRLGDLKWFCKEDTLYIKNSRIYIYIFKIIKLNNNELVVVDVEPKLNHDTLRYSRSKIQVKYYQK